MPRARFLDIDDKIFSILHVSRFKVGFHLFEVTHLLQAVLADAHAHEIERLARRHRQFPANHLVLRLGVPLDVDSLDETFPAFFAKNFVNKIDRATFGIWNFNRTNIDIDVALRAVEVANRFRIAPQAERSENIALRIALRFLRTRNHFRLHLASFTPETLHNLFLAEGSVAFDVDRTDAILLSLGNDESDDHFSRRDLFELHILKFEIDIPLVLVELSQLLFVFNKHFV